MFCICTAFENIEYKNSNYLNESKKIQISGLITVNEPLSEFLPSARYLSTKRRSRSGFGEFFNNYITLKRLYSINYNCKNHKDINHLVQGFPTCGTRTTSGTRRVSQVVRQKHLICQKY